MCIRIGLAVKHDNGSFTVFGLSALVCAHHCLSQTVRESLLALRIIILYLLRV